MYYALASYPPGISLLLILGESFNPMLINYLRFVQEFNRKLPGFETDVHGLVAVEEDGERVYCVDCMQW